MEWWSQMKHCRPWDWSDLCCPGTSDYPWWVSFHTRHLHLCRTQCIRWDWSWDRRTCQLLYRTILQRIDPPRSWKIRRSSGIRRHIRGNADPVSEMLRSIRSDCWGLVPKLSSKFQNLCSERKVLVYKKLVRSGMCTKTYNSIVQWFKNLINKTSNDIIAVDGR